MLKEQCYEKAKKVLTSAGKFHIKLGLERVKALLELFNNPQNEINCIHVAGTNGKGSTCAMLNSILTEAGYKTGLYTSPHLIKYTERIKISKEDISEEAFSELILEVVEKAESNNIPVTEFEILTVASFVYFFRQKVDIAIIETGLGGRLDATNVIEKPLFSIITSISLDHTDRLGQTLEEIAYEKSGIIKNYRATITLENNNGINVIKEQAALKRSEMIYADKKSEFFQYIVAAPGYQVINLTLVEAAIRYMREKGIDIKNAHVKKGLKNFNWAARFQFIKELDLIIDGAHNPEAALELRKSVDKFFFGRQKVWIYSSLATKNYKQNIKNLYRDDDVLILTKNKNTTCVDFKDKEIFLELFNKTSVNNVFITDNLTEALEKYREIRSNSTIGVATGSLYLAGDLLELIQGTIV